MPPFEFLRKLSFDFITAREQPLRTPLETNKVDEPFGRVFQVTFEEAKLVAGSERSSVHLVAQPLAEALHEFQSYLELCDYPFSLDAFA